MANLVNRYGTPFIVGFFLVSLISGIALFFGWEAGYFHSMHEWLSMVLIVPFVAHVWRNWRPMVSYMRHPRLYIALALSVLAALPFLMPAQGTGRSGPPQFALAQRLLNSTVSTAAPVFGLSTDDLTARLADAGFAVTSDEETLAAVAAAAGKSPAEIAATLAALR